MTTDVGIAVLEKLYRHGYIGGRHTATEGLHKGFPKHLRGKVDRTVKKLAKEGWLV